MSEEQAVLLKEIDRKLTRVETFLFEEKTGLKDIMLDIRGVIWGKDKDPGMKADVNALKEQHIAERKRRQMYDGAIVSVFLIFVAFVLEQLAEHWHW